MSRLTKLENLVTHTVTATQQDEILEIDILDTNITTLEKRMRRRKICVEVVTEEVVFRNTIATRTARHQRCIDTIVLQRLDDISCHHLTNLKFNLWILLNERRDKLMQQVWSDRRNHAQTHLSHSLASHLGNRLANVVVGTQRLAHLLKYHLADSRRNNRLLRAVEKYNTELLLQCLNLH